MSDQCVLLERQIEDCKSSILRNEDDIYAISREIETLSPENENLSRQHLDLYKRTDNAALALPGDKYRLLLQHKWDMRVMASRIMAGSLRKVVNRYRKMYLSGFRKRTDVIGD